MSEIKLNLIDSHLILSGTIHASLGDCCVAALSAEPETIDELQEALIRYERVPPNFAEVFNPQSAPDTEAYDAGLLIIDLASRTVACDSTYSLPGPKGEVFYDDGTICTELPIQYQLPDDWLFVGSAGEYEELQGQRRKTRASNIPLDARPVLYGQPLTEFIARSVEQKLIGRTLGQISPDRDHGPIGSDPISNLISTIHRSWLTTPRDDLRGQSPREVMLAKQDLINFDMETRIAQWSFQLEGPPSLSHDSYAYRFAGFGTHEWVIYYELIRYLLSSAIRLCHSANHGMDNGKVAPEALQERILAKPDIRALTENLERLKLNWLSEPNLELEGHRPFLVIDNERKRLPEAMGGRSMVIDEDCPVCKMMGDESERGLGVYFWRLDTAHLDEEFAFSTFKTIEEWQEHQREMEAFHREFQRKWQKLEDQKNPDRDSSVDPFFDQLGFFPPSFKIEPPES